MRMLLSMLSPEVSRDCRDVAREWFKCTRQGNSALIGEVQAGTSKMCAECGGKLEGMHVSCRHPQGVWAVQSCKNNFCNAIVHRDVNAARNMLALLHTMVDGQQRPPYLRREGVAAMQGGNQGRGGTRVG